MYDDLYVLEPTEPRRENNLTNEPASTDEDKFENHPMWVRIQDVLRKALEPFAEARAAVLLGLDELFAASSP